MLHGGHRRKPGSAPLRRSPNHVRSTRDSPKVADATLTDQQPTGSGPARFASTRPAGPGGLLSRVLLAAAGGVLTFLAFPPVDTWPLAPVGVAVLLVATWRQRTRWGALFGFAAGIGLFLPLLAWIRVLGTDVWIGLGVLQAAYWAFLGAGQAAVSRLPGWPAWAAALWVTEEAVRGRVPFGGFPWGRLAFSQGHSGFTPYAAVGGAPLVTFLVAATGALGAYAALALRFPLSRRLPTVRAVCARAAGRPVAARAGRPVRASHAAAAAALAVAVPAAGYAIPVPSGGKPATVAAIQGNTPGAGPAAETQTPPGVLLGNHVAATHRLADRVRSGEAPRPDFAVWPETASLVDPYASKRARTRITGAADDLAAPVLVGAYAAGPEPGGLRNMGIAWNPRTGPGDTYSKRRLVPFGEYVPFRDVLTRYFDRLQMVGADTVPGNKPGTLRIAGITVADTICFDIAYDGIVRDAVTGGGRLLVVQTNNNTYIRTAQPQQQLAIERFRAVEHGRATVVAATSGVSAIIGPDGRLLATSQPLTQQALVQRVPLREELTLADRLGRLPLWLFTAVGVLGIALAIAASARDGDRGRGRPR